MTEIVSAPVRSGKTLHCMDEIDKATKQNPYQLIYTNIVGCTYPGVILINSTLHKPFDWRDLPNGSFLIYDEAHEHPAFSKDDLLTTFEIDDSECIKNIAEINARDDLKVKEKEELVRQERDKQKKKLIKAKEDILDIGRSLTLHGHFGIRIIFITQKPYKLNDSVKASVHEHRVIRRLFKMQWATIFYFAELQEQFGFSTRKNALSWRFWKYPQYLYKFYVSAEVHDQKTKFPFGLIALLCLPFLVFGSAIYDSLQSPLLRQYLPSFLLPDEKKNEASTPMANTPSNTNVSNDSRNNVDCNVYENLHLPDCQLEQKERNAKLQSDVAQVISYDPNDPYRDMSSSLNYQATTKPQFAGCIKYANKFYAYTQQGTRLNVSESDCKKLIENGDRPFNYFAEQRQQTSISENRTTIISDDQDKKMTPEQYAKYLQYLTQQNVANNVNLVGSSL